MKTKSQIAGKTTIDNIELSTGDIDLNTDALESLASAQSVSQVHAKILSADDCDINYTHSDIGLTDERITSITYDGTIDLVNVVGGAITPTAKQTTDTLSYTLTGSVYTLNRKERSITI